MAIKIKLIRAGTLEDLERAINRFAFSVQKEDDRTLVDIAGGITHVNGTYIATIRIIAAHKRLFDETPGVPRFAQ